MSRTTTPPKAGSTSYSTSATLVPAKHGAYVTSSKSFVSVGNETVLVRGTYVTASGEAQSVKVTIDPNAISRKLAIQRVNAELRGSMDGLTDTSGASKG